jgi:hypothetical protein
MTFRRIAIMLAATLGVGCGTAFAATLHVASSHLWTGGQTLTKGACTPTGTASTTDTYVDASHASTNYGGSTQLDVATGSDTAWAFIRFSLSSCGLPTTGGADSATLKLYVVPSLQSRTLTVTPVLGSWSNTLTYSQATRLTYGPATTTISTPAFGGWISIPVTVDVDALIKNPNANYGWRISDQGGSSATTVMASSNSSLLNPQLVIADER